MNDLTIAIPTYNRKERLMEQLHSLIRQSDFDRVNVLICDNNSNYDVKLSVEKTFGLRKNVEVVKNKLNIGGDANIALLFLRCKSQWMWILGDDDETTEDSINTILKDIELYPNIAYFKYSIKNFTPYSDVTVKSLEEYIDYYHYGNNSTGDMIFMSNNIYNLNIIGPYYKNTLINCFCRVSQLLPVFNLLMEKRGEIMFRSHPIVFYRSPEKGTAWNMLDISIGIASLPLLNFDIDRKHYHRLMLKISRSFPHDTIVKHCLKINNRYQSKLIYRHIFRCLFKERCNFRDILLFLAFHFLWFFRIKLN